MVACSANELNLLLLLVYANKQIRCLTTPFFNNNCHTLSKIDYLLVLKCTNIITLHSQASPDLVLVNNFLCNNYDLQLYLQSSGRSKIFRSSHTFEDMHIDGIYGGVSNLREREFGLNAVIAHSKLYLGTQ